MSIADRLNSNRNLDLVEDEMATNNHIISTTDLKLIPNFDGNPSNLIKFINKLNFVANNVCTLDNPHHEYNAKQLIGHATNKLVGHAEYCGRRNYSSLNELIQELKLNFRDDKTIPQSIAEIYQVKPLRGEHPIAYVERLIVLRDELEGRLYTDDTKTETQKNTEMNVFDEQITDHCQRHLDVNVDNFLQHVVIKTLRDLKRHLKTTAVRVVERAYNKTNDYTKPQQRMPVNNYKGRNFDPYFHERKREYNNQQQNYQKPYYNQQAKPSYDPNHKPNFQYQRDPNARYNQSWKPHEQRQYFNKPQQQSPPDRENQTVSMRTVSNRVHHTELEEKDRQIYELTKRLENLETRYEDFLDVGHREGEPPPDPSTN